MWIPALRPRVLNYVSVNSKTAHLPRAIPEHLTRVKLRTVGNLTQNKARPVGAFDFSGRKQKISKFFDSAREPRPCRFHVGFSVVVVLYSYIVEYAFL